MHRLFQSCLILSWSLESYIKSGLVMKTWIFHLVLTCHECKESSIQSYFVMKTWLFSPFLTCHEVLTLHSLNPSSRPDSYFLSRLVMKSWILHPVLTLTSCLDLSWSLEYYIIYIRYWLVMKPWLFLTVLTCHACINSSIQSCLVMKTWPLPPVLYCHVAWILHQVWSHHEDLTLLSGFDLSWKHRFFLFSFQSWIVMNLWLDSLISGLVIHDLTLA